MPNAKNFYEQTARRNNRLAVNQLNDRSTSALTHRQRHKMHMLGRALLLSSSAVTCFAAFSAGDPCLIASPLMSSAFHMSGTPTFSSYLFLLLGVHGGKPSEPSGHTDTSLYPWTKLYLSFSPNGFYPSIYGSKLIKVSFFVSDNVAGMLCGTWPSTHASCTMSP